jgi:hypothetical protein
VSPVEYCSGVTFLRRKMTPESLFYYSTGAFFYNLLGKKSEPSRILTGGGVIFLRRKMTPGSLIYVVIFLQPSRRKMTPKAMNSTEKGVTFLSRILTGGHIST